MSSPQVKLPNMTISPFRVHHLRIRFTFNSKQRELVLPDDKTLAEHMCQIMRQDIRQGVFDESMQRYRSIVSGQIKAPLVIDYQKLFALYLNEKGYAEPADATDAEYATYRMVMRFELTDPDDIRNQFIKLKYAPSTYSDRLSVLKKWTAWMMKKKYIASCPLELLKFKERYPGKNPKRQPLPDNTILDVLEALRTDRFKKPAAHVKDSTYYSPLMFMVYTGCRPQEVIGLRVRYIRFDLNRIQIREVLAKKRSKSSAKNLKRKEPKTSSGVRDIPMYPEIRDVLLQQCATKQPDDLVFLSPRSMAIDARRMSAVWKKYLFQLGIHEVDPYSIRHAFGTRWNEQKLNPVDGAMLMGHKKVDVFFNTYSHSNRDQVVELPKIGDMGKKSTKH